MLFKVGSESERGENMRVGVLRAFSSYFFSLSNLSICSTWHALSSPIFQWQVSFPINCSVFINYYFQYNVTLISGHAFVQGRWNHLLKYCFNPLIIDWWKTDSLITGILKCLQQFFGQVIGNSYEIEIYFRLRQCWMLNLLNSL